MAALSRATAHLSASGADQVIYFYVMGKLIDVGGCFAATTRKQQLHGLGAKGRMERVA
jgi:hypothetical protein